MIKKLESNKGGNTEFLKKLLVTSQLQINNALNKLGNKPRNYLENPSLPGITQFKPQGASNIFSPLIDINTSNPADNDRFSEAYQQGFKEAMKTPTTVNSTRGDTSYVSLSSKETSQTIKDSYNPSQKSISDIDDSFIMSTGGNKKDIQTNDISSQESQYQKETSSNQNKNKNQNKNNGYTKRDNSNLAIPGYSYIHPQHFDVPQQRTPVCHSDNNGERGNDAIHPAGYLSSGHSNVMEFHSVGAILPKFDYQENVEHKEDNTNRI